MPIVIMKVEPSA